MNYYYNWITITNICFFHILLSISFSLNDYFSARGYWLAQITDWRSITPQKSKKTVREKSLKYAGKNCWFSSLLCGFKCWSVTNGGLLHLEHVQVLYFFEQFHLIDAWEPWGLCFWETRLFLGPGLTSNYLENNFYLTTTFNSSWGKGVCFAVTSFSVGKFESQIN